MKTITSGEQVNEYVNYPTPSPLSNVFGVEHPNFTVQQ